MIVGSSRVRWVVGACIVASANFVSCSSSKEENDTSLEATEPKEEDAATADAADKTEAPAAKTAKEAPATPAAVSVPMAAPSAPSPAGSGSGAAASASAGRRVMYVKTDNTPMREAADAKGKVVGKLNKGDHILVTIDGAWSRTDDGKFIATKSLSEKGIGRGKADATWGGGGAAASDTPPAPSAAGKGASKKSGTKKADVKDDKKAAPSTP